MARHIARSSSAADGGAGLAPFLVGAASRVGVRALIQWGDRPPDAAIYDFAARSFGVAMNKGIWRSVLAWYSA